MFKRVGKLHMRRIAHRILDAEGFSIDPGALETLIEGNPGDLRALIRDLQVVSVISGQHINIAAVEDLASVSIRDSQIDVFKALQEIYKSGSGKKAKPNFNEVLIKIQIKCWLGLLGIIRLYSIQNH